MAEAWHEHEMTPEQIDQVKTVERALCNELNLQAREGVPMPVLLTAIGMAAADLLTCQVGAHAIAPWFEKQAAMLRRLQRPH